MTRGTADSSTSAGRVPSRTASRDVFVEYFRCPSHFGAFGTADTLPEPKGFFAFGDAVGFGRARGVRPSQSAAGPLDNATAFVESSEDGLRLPFDLAEVVTNLRLERYTTSSTGYVEALTTSSAVQGFYYFLRPLLPVAVRRHLQRARLRGWDRIAFPRWPVDTSVDVFMRKTLALLLTQSGIRRLPFVWFWPDGAPSCAVMTHDIEGPAGRDFCGTLMDLDDAFDVKSAFQIVPEVRGDTRGGLVEQIRSRGFEVNIHDLNHDGYLFQNKAQFLKRAAEINNYTRSLRCGGFRSGSMYREQEWFEAFEFSYDMSVPNGAHLEPQRGGCCTVMPYFVGKILELPLTTTQDYSLFHILGEYSIALWKQQIDLIQSMNGFISFIAHPDYLIEARARAVYMNLLSHLRALQRARKVWIALPGDVDRWWRNRAQMTVRPAGDSWRIEGPGSERARLAYASLEGDRIVYTVA
jgi:hypothetical protein